MISDLASILKKYLVIVLGPTASGKTSLAIRLAKYFSTEIISADSRQFYREMNIGTAKPSDAELKEVKHHLVNSISIRHEYNAALFEKDALLALKKIFSSHDIALVAGGSGMYIHALCHGFDSVPPSDKMVRESLVELWKEQGIEPLKKELKEKDEAYFNKVDLSNPHRIIRALEVCRISGIPFSTFRKGAKRNRNFGIIKIGILPDRKELYENINRRVDEMFRQGLEAEARALFPLQHLNSLNTVGYKELFACFEGKIDLASAADLIKKNTRHFARRQLTWFRKDKEIAWFHPSEKGKMLEYINRKISAG